jgi:hypothetical protein
MVIRTRNPRPCADHYQLKLSFPEGWSTSEHLTTSAGGFSETQIVRVILALFLLFLAFRRFHSRLSRANPQREISPGRWGENGEVSRHIGRASPLPRRKFGLAELDGNLTGSSVVADPFDDRLNHFDLTSAIQLLPFGGIADSAPGFADSPWNRLPPEAAAARAAASLETTRAAGWIELPATNALRSVCLP